MQIANKAGLGDFLVDNKGMTLYYFTRDVTGKSNASAAVLANWPIFNPASFLVAPTLDVTDFATITRADGAKQATYKGWPLYYYIQDKAPGDVLGEGVGGAWFVVKAPFYSVMLQTKTGVGNYLVDAKGMTLYYFTRDTIGKSNASGSVVFNWPVFGPSNFVIPSTLKAADFGTITRDDGTKQATYKGWPLYYYLQDKASGDTLGEGVGGNWFVMKEPFYTIMLENKVDIGNYLVDTKGKAIYYFTNDGPGKSTVTGGVLANWPIFNVDSFILPSSVNATDFTTITRDDGAKQAAYKNWPLYYYIQDKAPGDTAGQGINNVWFAVVPGKAPLQPPLSGEKVNISLAASGFAFDKSSITVPAGANVIMTFTNNDGGIPHNFALYTDRTASKSIFVGPNVTGAKIITYTFTAPTTPGTYYYRCDVHPGVMNGNFIVTAVP